MVGGYTIGESDYSNGGAFTAISMERLRIQDAIFTGNSASAMGGAVWLAGENRETVIVNTTFSGNYVKGALFGEGGALSIQMWRTTGQMSYEISSSTFSDNTYIAETAPIGGGYGGGALCIGANVGSGSVDFRISETDFSGNRTENTPSNDSFMGGGAVLCYTNTASTLFSFDHCTFSGNVSLDIGDQLSYTGGGAIYYSGRNEYGVLELNQCSFSGNKALSSQTFSSDGKYAYAAAKGGALLLPAVPAASR